MVPTRSQIQRTREVVAWYLRTHHGSDSDLGLLWMFCDRRFVGSFAVDPGAIARGDADALFRLLIMTAMFQRLRDTLVLRILRAITPGDVRELTSPARLVALAASCACEHAHTHPALLERCDLTKHPATKHGTCSANPRVACHLKRHTVLLKRYGHFGKMPTSAALVVHERGGDLAALRQHVYACTADPGARARLLEQELSRIWRVSQKISSMYLSLLTNPDLATLAPPWQAGVDWTYFVVIDSNVDLFLRAIGYAGLRSYDARRDFLRTLAACIDLSALEPSLSPFNPRLVQQAMYLFMSSSNRAAAARDCSHRAPVTCNACPRRLRALCQLQPGKR